MNACRFAVALLLAVLAGCVAPTACLTKQWANTTTSGHWLSSDNWLPSGPPQAGDDVLLGAGNYTVYVGGYDEEQAAVAVATVAVGGGARLDIVGDFAATSWLDVDGGQLSLYPPRYGGAGSQLRAGAVTVRGGGALIGQGLIDGDVSLLDNSQLVVPVLGYDTANVSLRISGSLTLSNTSLTRLWAWIDPAQPNTSSVTFAQLQIGGRATLGGRLDVVQLSGLAVETVVFITWSAVTPGFANISQLGFTDVQAECPTCGAGPLCPACPLPASAAERQPCTGRYACANGWCDAAVDQCASCTDGAANIDETDIDCGGPACSPCLAWQQCLLGRDCGQQPKFGRLLCEQVTAPLPADVDASWLGQLRCLGCGDRVHNFGESDVDCGAVCSLNQCKQGQQCLLNADCRQFGCNANTSRCTGCGDLELSPQTFESDVDCGGTCATKCAIDQLCNADADCLWPLACPRSAGRCSQPCANGMLDGNETDIDCGGPDCQACNLGEYCLVDADCASRDCYGASCPSGTCSCLSFNIQPPPSPPPPTPEPVIDPTNPLPPADGCHEYMQTGLAVLFSSGQACTAYCPFGWTGYPQCQVPLCEPVASNLDLLNDGDLRCWQHGDCLVQPSGDPACDCYPGWKGTDCSLIACPRSPGGAECYRPHGSCVPAPDGNGGVCDCTAQWRGVDCSLPVCPNDCSARGVCTVRLDQPYCDCIDDWTGADCSLCGGPSCAPPPGNDTSTSLCPPGACGLGACLPADGSCQCPSFAVGARCQYLLCSPSSRATYVRLSFPVDAALIGAGVDPVDYFMLTVADQLAAAVALAAGVSPSAVCLVQLQLETQLRAAAIVGYYPAYALNPAPRQPYACNTTCPEAQQAYDRLAAALVNGSATAPLDQSTSFEQAFFNYSLQCPGDCSQRGVCWFGACICDDQWTGADCTLESCPGEPDCNGNGVCLSNYTELPLRRCACYDQWSGVACETPSCPLNCSGRGDCDGSGAVPACVCDSGYKGDACEINTMPQYDGAPSVYRWLALGFCAGAVVVVLLSWLLICASRRGAAQSLSAAAASASSASDDYPRKASRQSGARSMVGAISPVTA